MLITSNTAEREALLDLAKQICVAARTAPKACGIDNTDSLILTGADKAALTAQMRLMGAEIGPTGAFFVRDADNVDASEVIVLIGISYDTRGLGEKCKLCGLENCAAVEAAGVTCAFTGIDLGIAIGSAAALAARAHADNRILFTAGKAAAALGLLGEHSMILGLPLSASGKNVFFDRPLR